MKTKQEQEMLRVAAIAVVVLMVVSITGRHFCPSRFWPDLSFIGGFINGVILFRLIKKPWQIKKPSSRLKKKCLSFTANTARQIISTISLL